jgi:uncharacterized protein (TIGR00730 family)
MNSSDTTSGNQNSKKPTAKQDLIERIRESADKLERDGSSRGDLKLLSRALRELRYAFKVFSPYRRTRKVTVFGSARTRPDQPAYKHAVEFGRRIAQHDWMVITGAASGIMEAGHVGAGREKSMGLNIMLPFEQAANPIIDGDDKLVHMKYFFTRKLMFVKECHAVVCLPGGFGTLDEALEVLTLLQTGKREMMPLVLLDAPGGTYWTSFCDFVRRELLGGQMISAEDSSLYLVTDEVGKAVDDLVTFYRVYHSMRYVRKHLVFRLHRALDERTLDDLNDRFSRILVAGRIEQTAALQEEDDEPDLADMPRLKFQFDRRSHGLLRDMIDVINRFDR